jgi:hypothetical protein
MRRELIASRPVKLQKTRWMDDVIKDDQAMNIVNWKSCAQEINFWTDQNSYKVVASSMNKLPG